MIVRTSQTLDGGVVWWAVSETTCRLVVLDGPEVGIHADVTRAVAAVPDGESWATDASIVLRESLGAPTAPWSHLAVSVGIAHLTSGRANFVWAGDVRLHVREPTGSWRISHDHTLAARADLSGRALRVPRSVAEGTLLRAFGGLPSQSPELLTVAMPTREPVFICTSAVHLHAPPAEYADSAYTMILANGIVQPAVGLCVGCGLVAVSRPD